MLAGELKLAAMVRCWVVLHHPLLAHSPHTGLGGRLCVRDVRKWGGRQRSGHHAKRAWYYLSCVTQDLSSKFADRIRIKEL